MAVDKESYLADRCLTWLKNHPLANMAIVVVMALLVGVGSYLVGVLSMR